MICLFVDNEPSLLLREVKRDEQGDIKSALVVNGAWNFEIKEGEVLAKSGNYIVNRWPVPNYHEMQVPDSVKGDYNQVMWWAREEYLRINKGG